MDFTDRGHDALETLQVSTGLSRNSILAHLVERHAATLTFAKPGVVYDGKRAANVMAIRLPTKQRRLLVAAHKRTGKSYSDIGEALVRTCAKGENWPVMPDNRKALKLRGRKRGRGRG